VRKQDVALHRKVVIIYATSLAEGVATIKKSPSISTWGFI
jgi:hypothetical protein